MSIEAEIDRAAADGKISAEDAQTVHAFAAFLSDPKSRCPMCLGADHTRPSQCPEVTDEERRRYGVMRMDVSSAKQVSRVRVAPFTPRGPDLTPTTQAPHEAPAASAAGHEEDAHG